MSASILISPYRGLTPFEDSDLDVLFFFGRERERDLIEANLMASRLTVLYGETGVGKSSVLRAGVAHHLRSVAGRNLAERGEPGLAVVVFDTWRDDPLQALRTAVGEAVTQALGGSLPPPEEDGSLIEALRMWGTLLDGELYVILDQAEEYFLYHAAEDGPGTFAAEFPAAVNSPDLRVNFVLAIREDALAKLDVFKGQIPNVLGNYLRLEHLDPRSARAAIVEPVRRYNELVAVDDAVEIEPGLVDAVLEQVVAGKVEVGQAGRGTVGNGDGAVRIETAYLQLVMHRLWDAERSSGSRVVRLETLHRLGGAEQIVRDHVDDALTELTPDEKDVVARIFDHLVTPSGAKIAHEVVDLAKYAGTDEAELVPVLTKLGNERILRSVAGNGSHGSGYEIFHDVLAEPVLAWKAGHEAQRELERQAAETERRHKALRRLLVLAAAALIVMTAITVFAVAQWSDARSQAKLAHGRELAAAAVSTLGVDPLHSLSLALSSARLKRTSEAEDALRQALYQTRERAILPSRGPVRTVAFSPGGSLVLTASADGSARLWRSDGRLVWTRRSKRPLAAASFSGDGSLVLTAGADGTARIWRTATGDRVATLHHGGRVGSASFSADDARVVTAGADGTVRVWDASTGEQLGIVRLAGPARSATFSPDGGLLLVRSGDRRGSHLHARLFDAATGRRVRELPADGVTTASFSPDGRTIVTGSTDGNAALWRTSDGSRLFVLPNRAGAVTDASFGPGGLLVATATSSGATRIWYTASGTASELSFGHAKDVYSVAFSNDGRFLVTASRDGTARVWETVNPRQPVAVLRGHAGPVVDAVFSPDANTVATAGLDGTARLWDPVDLRVLAASLRPFRAASFSPDGRLVLAAGDDGEVRILTTDGRVVRTLPGSAPIVDAAFAGNGRFVVADDADGVLRLWATRSGTRLRSAPDVTSGQLAVSRDGRLLAAPTANGGLGIWRLPTLRRVRVLSEGGPFTAAAFSPDGRQLATAGKNHAAMIRDARTGEVKSVLRRHKGALTDVEFSPDGRLLVTSSLDHDAWIWDVATGKPVAVLSGNSGAVQAASFSPDGRWVVTAGPTTAGLWDVSSNPPIVYLRGHTDKLTAASFSPDGTRILTASVDGTVRTYDCLVCGDFDALVAAADARLAAISDPLTPDERHSLLPAGGGS